MRLAELLGTLSVAADIGMGMPSDHGLRCAAVATQLGRLCQLPLREQADAFYLSLLRFAGCTADSDLAAEVMGDEIRVRGALYGVDWRSPGEFLSCLVHALGAASSLRGASTFARAMAKMPKLMNAAQAHCEVGDRLAEQMGFDDRFRAALFQSFERWDGRGWPSRSRGEAIARAMRLVHVAEDFEVGHRTGGVVGGRELIGRRAGKSLDPTLVERALEHSDELCRLLDASSPWEATMRTEPEPMREAAPNEVDTILCAMGDLADLKSNYTRGHSRGVAALARAAAEALHFLEEDVVTVERAAHVHDLGRVAVSTGVWDKPGSLSDGEWEQVRLHTYVGERILSRAAALASIGEVASAAHERLDGTGYHRRVEADACKMAARVLAAADVYRALTEERPHRRAFAPARAAEELTQMAQSGLLCPDAAQAVLSAAGHLLRPRAPKSLGLTDREIEVLRLVARGLTNKEVARALNISVKTAGRHLENIFTKIGVTTRAAAAMWAMQKGIVR